MALKMETVTRFYDEDGKVITQSERTATVPGIEEIVRDGFRTAFNELEKTVLETTNSTRQTAVTDLMEELSKKKTEAERTAEGTLVEKGYKIQGELGSLKTTGHKWVVGDETKYDSTQSFFEGTGSRESFKSDLFRELMLTIPTEMSYRRGVEFLDRMRRTDNGMIEMTLRNCVEREGNSIQRCIEEKTSAAIDEIGLAVEGSGEVVWEATGEKVEQDELTSNCSHIDEEIVHAAAKRLKLEEGSYNPSEYEQDYVNISCDEVGVNRQTESRPREEGKAQPRRVENTVIHVEVVNESEDPKVASSSSYALNSPTVPGAFKLLLGLLCMKGMLGKTMVFFVDGARNLHTSIITMFGFANVKIILDWYHLRKKMEETLSMICNNRFYRNEMLQKIMPLLWRGNTDGAIETLKSINEEMVKDKDKLKYLVGYLERVRLNIPNYMLRAALGLRNSSNSGEKLNDLLVSNRQKHNGMSWSDSGSTSLASVSALLYNDELDNWVNKGTLSFQFVERKTIKRAKRNVRIQSPPLKTDNIYSIQF